MPRKKTKKDYIFAVGRRREAVARVRLYKGKDQHTVNSLPIGQYFPGEMFQKIWIRPFQVTQTEGKYYITAKVSGGGKTGQIGAVTLGTARAFIKINRDYKPLLKKYGLLTRDPRAKERRKVGTGGKARRKKQSPKR